jgi:transcriptional regulator with XRE-family HTH domain
MAKLSTIRAEIARLGLKQYDLAYAVGLRADALSQVLNGRRVIPGKLAEIWAYLKNYRAARAVVG